MTTVIEKCGIPPTPGVAAELTVPLSFFDFLWLHFHPIRRLIFYQHSCSEPDFINSIVPKLKHSLSLTLKHYLPVAANLIYPSHTEKSRPFIRYVSGDTVPLTFAVSDQDFDELTASHGRYSDQFYDFMPQMPPLRDEGEYKLVPLIALQATLFPGRGICIGLSNHHCLGDARSIVGFMWAWAEINKFDGDEEFLSKNSKSLPFFDRSVLGDCSRMNDIFWDAMTTIPLQPSSFPLPTNRVRASFTLHQSDIRKLKNRVSSANHDLVDVSSFVVTAAYVWICFVKSGDAVGEEVGGDEAEFFGCAADGRERPNAIIDPPVPANYFGNLIDGPLLSIQHRKLVADDGFPAAAAGIADKIKNFVNNKDQFFKNMDRLLSLSADIGNMRLVSVSGSPKFDLSNADFGWGKARRVEILSLDEDKYTMSLCNSTDGGLVIGISLPRDRMEAFADEFQNGLNYLINK